MSKLKSDLSRFDPQFNRVLLAMEAYQEARRSRIERQAVRTLHSLQAEQEIKKIQVGEIHKQAWRATRKRHAEEVNALRAYRVVHSPRGLGAAMLQYVGINAITSAAQRRENKGLLSGQRAERVELLAQKHDDLSNCELSVYRHYQRTAKKLEALTALDTREETAMMHESIRRLNRRTEGATDQTKGPIAVPTVNMAFRRAVVGTRDKGR